MKNTTFRLTEEEARERIAKGWTQGSYAKNELGGIQDFASFRACSFCALGAIKRAALTGAFPDNVELDAIIALERCIPEEYFGNVPAFND